MLPSSLPDDSTALVCDVSLVALVVGSSDVVPVSSPLVDASVLGGGSSAGHAVHIPSASSGAHRRAVCIHSIAFERTTPGGGTVSRAGHGLAPASALPQLRHRVPRVPARRDPVRGVGPHHALRSRLWLALAHVQR